MVQQAEIEQEWDCVWNSSDSGAQSLFNHQLFRFGYDAFKPYVDPQQTFNFLEVGAGSGRYGLKFAQEFTQGSFTLTDPTEGSVNFMKKVKQQIVLNNTVIELADATNLHYADESFDVVFADAVIQHVIDTSLMVAEMKRVLKPGGIVIISAVNRRNMWHSLYKFILKLRKKKYEYSFERCFSAQELRQILKDNHFQDIKSDGFFHAYGILRHKRRSKWVGMFGVCIHRLTLFLDRHTKRWFTRNYGFEVFVVGHKSDRAYE